ncbi:MAG: cytochrome c [Burkholderiaceae bacterium]|jgi:mono/diheme cytochrome c family protein|nr:cytochrome c [Burkholderiaceae bacterium]
MRSAIRNPLLLAAALAVFGAAHAQPKAPDKAVDAGKREYDANCANCHGIEGKGHGPYNQFLQRSAPDLTQLAANNGGVFPLSRVYEAIEGAGAAHGSRDMPIWGQDYKIRAGEYYMDIPYDPEVYVRTRILALVEYINRLQRK